jgi:N-acetylmuramoyl-L-alanine amidase
MPSVLIETTFISHPGEERKLRSRTFQKQMARAIYEGIRRFAKKNRLRPRSSGTTVATSSSKRVHVVRRGDTLSEIAQRYQVNVSALRFANNLDGNRLVVGKRLIIPN